MQQTKCQRKSKSFITSELSWKGFMIEVGCILLLSWEDTKTEDRKNEQESKVKKKRKKFLQEKNNILEKVTEAVRLDPMQ